jgi:hypothetical protein
VSYEELGAEIGRLVEEKQAAYGDSFGRSGEVIRAFYPTGIPPEKLDDALGVIRIVDKLFRIATDRDALGESPWRDIAGYGLLGAARVGREARDQGGTARQGRSAPLHPFSEP